MLASYALAAAHCILTFGIGEPYPSLQGPMFAGHLQRGRIIHVPFYRETEDRPRLPAHDRLLRHETLAAPVQRDSSLLVPALQESAFLQFLIGHSVRTRNPRPGNPRDFSGVEWSTYKVNAPLDSPPELIGEEDIIDD